MNVTRRMIADMRRYRDIDENLEALLLKNLGTEPYPHIYTEQDLYEQVRKMVDRYKREDIESPNQTEPGVDRSRTSGPGTEGGDLGTPF